MFVRLPDSICCPVVRIDSRVRFPMGCPNDFRNQIVRIAWRVRIELATSDCPDVSASPNQYWCQVWVQIWDLLENPIVRIELAAIVNGKQGNSFGIDMYACLWVEICVNCPNYLFCPVPRWMCWDMSWHGSQIIPNPNQFENPVKKAVRFKNFPNVRLSLAAPLSESSLSESLRITIRHPV